MGSCWIVEFQMRGLPHCHILLILDSKDRPQTPADCDTFVSAELLGRETCPFYFNTVVITTIHGPCGDDYPDAPCMIKLKNDKPYCSKGYPRCPQDKITVEKRRLPKVL
ncbi:hypothetical protein EDD21DRAFT_392088 [Dissophora ornata]|nr:hypothetical protein EDD21DRAFT_392088 [Dissophora ornata]